jgi:hypothetical protein
MQIPFTVEQFLGVFREYNLSVWPIQGFLVGMALLAIFAVFRPRPSSDIAVSLILALLWVWIAVAYHLVYFTRINPAAYAFAALSMAGAGVFVWQGVIRRRLAFAWSGGPRGLAGLALIGFALVIYPLWSIYVGHSYPEMPTFGLPCPTTIFTVGVLCFAKFPMPRSPVVGPVLWCLVGTQAAFQFGVWPDLGLLIAGVVGLTLFFTARPFHQEALA